MIAEMWTELSSMWPAWFLFGLVVGASIVQRLHDPPEMKR